MNELDCKDIKALLSGLVDGELDATTRHHAERHLAGCKPCRESVDEAESLNALIAQDAQRQAPLAGLPAGFENLVLRQTFYADAYHFAGRQWTSWLGWVAAAACLGLAASIWFLNPRAMQPDQVVVFNSPNVNQGAHPSSYAANGKSFIYDGELPDDAVASAHAPEETVLAVDTQLADVMPVAYGRNSITASGEPIDRDDSDTLYAAANLLEMLKNADVRSFADVERIRQIAEYDDLLDRLADSRNRLSPADRPAVMAAESILLRVINGPLSMDDLRMLHNTVASLDLSSQVQAISDRWQPASSL